MIRLRIIWPWRSARLEKLGEAFFVLFRSFMDRIPADIRYIPPTTLHYHYRYHHYLLLRPPANWRLYISYTMLTPLFLFFLFPV
jgi:hypothetical protein